MWECILADTRADVGVHLCIILLTIITRLPDIMVADTMAAEVAITEDIPVETGLPEVVMAVAEMATGHPPADTVTGQTIHYHPIPGIYTTKDQASQHAMCLDHLQM